MPKFITAAVVSAAGLTLAACQPGDGDGTAEIANEGEIQTMSTRTDRPVEAELAVYRAGFNERADESTKRTYQEGIDALAPVADGALGVGDTAPDFTLPAADGSYVTLSELLKKGPVILTWYRGGWCPYCNIALRGFQERLGDIEAAGASLVAISPELPDNSLSTQEKNELRFNVLSDSGNGVARSYNIAYTLPEPVQEAFKGKFDLATLNGDSSATLPLSATYIVKTDGTIAYAFVNNDYRVRAEPEDVIEALGRL